MSDWTSTYDAVAAANAGLDLEMPTAEKMCEPHLIPAIEEGKVTQDVIDDKVRRLLRLALRFGWLNSNQHISAISHADAMNQSVALDIARAGIVLLKNEIFYYPSTAINWALWLWWGPTRIQPYLAEGARP